MRKRKTSLMSGIKSFSLSKGTSPLLLRPKESEESRRRLCASLQSNLVQALARGTRWL